MEMGGGRSFAENRKCELHSKNKRARSSFPCKFYKEKFHLSWEKQSASWFFWNGNATCTKEPEIIPEAEAEAIFEDAIEEEQETRTLENDLPT